MENLEIYLDYIGDDSYVYRYNYDNKKYYNTGICLKGNPGNPGRPGKNGDSWSLKDIDGTYYWFKNGVNTGIPAQTNTNISGKEDVTTIVAPVNETDATLPITTLTTEIGKYYRIDVPIETLGITLPAMDTVTSVKKVDIYFTAGTTPAITIAAADNKSVAFQDGYEIETGKTYEINCLYNGAAWVVSALTIIKPFFAKLTLNNGEVVELEGSGELTNAIISSYRSTLVSAEIGTLCTSIGNGAFIYCSSLTSIDIPDSVTSIGNGAFASCSSLTSIDIPNSVTSIGEDAFQYCRGLTSVTIGNSVTSIGNNAFYYCSSLTSIDIPNSVTSIGEEAFRNCSGLTSVTIGNSVTSIGNNAFSDCSSLTTVNITDIESWCNINFDNANSNPLYIGHHLYLNNQEITDINIPNTLTTIKEYVFAGGSSITSVNIPNTITSIGRNAFYVCTGLTNITCNAMTAPTIQNSTFLNIKTGGTLTVPSGSSGYDVWMRTNNFYLGKYNWTKVEQ